jgi:hypothetical protein
MSSLLLNQTSPRPCLVFTIHARQAQTLGTCDNLHDKTYFGHHVKDLEDARCEVEMVVQSETNTAAVHKHIAALGTDKTPFRTCK